MNDSCERAGMAEISFTVNGEAKSIRAYPMERLLDVLRLEFGLTGAKASGAPALAFQAAPMKIDMASGESRRRIRRQ